MNRETISVNVSASGCIRGVKDEPKFQEIPTVVYMKGKDIQRRKMSYCL